MGKIDMFTVGIVERIAPTGRSTLELTDVVTYNNRFCSRTCAGTQLHHGGVFRRMVYVHHIVLDNATVTATEHVDGVVVGVGVVAIVNQVSGKGHMIGESGID